MSTFGIYEKTTCTTEIECWIFMAVTWYLGGVVVEIPIGWYDFIEIFSSARLLWRNMWQCDVTGFSVPFFLALLMVHPEVLDILRACKWWCSKKNLFPPSIFRMACVFFVCFMGFYWRKMIVYGLEQMNWIYIMWFPSTNFRFWNWKLKLDMTTYKQHLSTYSSVTNFWLLAHLLSIIKAGLIYSDLTRPHPKKVANSKGNPFISGKSRFQEISNRTHWTDPGKTWVSNSSIATCSGVRW